MQLDDSESVEVTSTLVQRLVLSSGLCCLTSDKLRAVIGWRVNSVLVIGDWQVLGGLKNIGRIILKSMQSTLRWVLRYSRLEREIRSAENAHMLRCPG